MGIFSKLFRIRKDTPEPKFEMKTKEPTGTKFEPKVTATIKNNKYVPPKTVELVTNITTTENKSVGEIKMPKESSDEVKDTKPKSTKKASTGTKKTGTSTKSKSSTGTKKTTIKKTSSAKPKVDADK